MREGLLLWKPLTDEDPVEEGCLGERQNRDNMEFLSTPSPVPFEALSPFSPQVWGKKEDSHTAE